MASPLGEATVTQSFCLLQEPQPQLPTCHLQMSPSARLEHQGQLWSTILPKPHIHDVAQRVNIYIWATRRNLEQSVSMFLEEIVQHVFFSLRFYLMVLTFVRGILSSSTLQRKQRRCYNYLSVLRYNYYCKGTVYFPIIFMSHLIFRILCIYHGKDIDLNKDSVM